MLELGTVGKDLELFLCAMVLVVGFELGVEVVVLFELVEL